MDKLQDALGHVRILGQLQKLRIALYNIAQYDIPRTVAHSFKDDGTPSKNDRCPHNMFFYEECAGCLAQYADDVLRGLDHGSSNFPIEKK